MIGGGASRFVDRLRGSLARRRLDASTSAIGVRRRARPDAARLARPAVAGVRRTRAIDPGAGARARGADASAPTCAAMSNAETPVASTSDMTSDDGEHEIGARARRCSPRSTRAEEAAEPAAAAHRRLAAGDEARERRDAAHAAAPRRRARSRRGRSAVAPQQRDGDEPR